MVFSDGFLQLLSYMARNLNLSMYWKYQTQYINIFFMFLYSYELISLKVEFSDFFHRSYVFMVQFLNFHSWIMWKGGGMLSVRVSWHVETQLVTKEVSSELQINTLWWESWSLCVVYVE